MKKFIFKSVFLLIVSISFFGCSSDDSKESEPIVCSQGYTGSNCTTQIAPTKIKISNFKVTMFNNLDGNSNWDNNSEPDIFLQLINGTSGSTIWLSETYYPNVLSNGTNSFDFTPTIPVEITNVNGLFTLYLGDEDTNDIPSNPNDEMADILFNIYSSTNGFPTTLNISDNENIPFRVTLTLSYEW